MSMLLTMEILRVASLLLPFYFYSIFCFPSRPLNERSTELAWQAWLLVDDQNQNKHYDSESFTRRRITPKSVFIAPTFSPESLPACADGYRPDSMGRCIKIIKLDEEAHLDFLLEKLNAQFGNYDELDDESQEDLPTAGPFQLNIPLAGTAEEQFKDHPNDNLDIAIVVAPTNGNFGLEDALKSTVKKTNLLNENSQTQNSQKKTSEEKQSSSTITNSKRKTENIFPIAEQIEVTTVFSDESTTLLDTETLSTEQEIEEVTTLPSSTSQAVATETTTSDIETDTTISHQHALFFLKPSLSNTKHVQNGTNNVEDTPMITSSDDSVVITNHSLTTLLSNSTLVVNRFSNLTNKQPVADALKQQEHFTDSITLGAHAVNSEDLMPSENVHRQSTEFVRFPTLEEESLSNTDYIKYPEKVTQNQFFPHVNSNIYASQFHHGVASPAITPQYSGFAQQNSQGIHTANLPKMQSSEQFSTLFDEYINSRGADLKGNERFVFKNRDPAPEATFPGNLEADLKHGVQKAHANHDRLQSNDEYEPVSERVYNHRNRDKHSNLWSLPTSWSESSPQKPIVLRFSRRSGSSRHLLEEHLLPHTQNSQAFYREVPTEDFSYIFGVKQNHNRRNNR